MNRTSPSPSTFRPRRAALLAAVCCLALIGCGGGASVGSTPEPMGGPFLYVANQTAASVTVIDAGSMAVADVIDLEAMGFGANANPHDVAVEPDGSAWYVSLIGANRVLKFDRSNELVAEAEFEVPGLLSIHPTRDWLFVGRSMAAVNPPSRIGRIERSTMEVEEFEVFIPRPHGIVASPDGRWVYVASLAENTLAVLDASTGEAGLARVGNRGEQMVVVQLAMSPDGETLVATGQTSAKLFVFRAGGGAAGLELVHEIDVGAEPWHPSFTPDGTEVWFGNLAADEVTVVNAADWSVVDVITDPAISEPHGSAVAGDGTRVYVASRNTDGRYTGVPGSEAEGPPGTVVILDRSTHEVLRVIETPPYAAGVGISSGGR